MPYLVKNILFLLCTTTLLLLPIFVLLFIFRKKLEKKGINWLAMSLLLMLFGTVLGTFSWLMSKPYAKYILDIKNIDSDIQDPRLNNLMNVVSRTAKKAGLKNIPETGYYVSSELNAFAIGTTTNNSLIAVSTGLLKEMDDEELEGVIGHEISHIAQGDMAAKTVMNGVANSSVIIMSRVIGSFINSKYAEDYVIKILQNTLGIVGITWINHYSRNREYRADEGSASLYGKAKIIKALRKLQQNASGADSKQVNSFATLKIYGSATGFLKTIFATHPLLEERIMRLESLDIATAENEMSVSISTSAVKEEEIKKTVLVSDSGKALDGTISHKTEYAGNVSALSGNALDNPSLDKSVHTAVTTFSEALPMSGMNSATIFNNVLVFLVKLLINLIYGIPYILITGLSAKFGNTAALVKLGDDAKAKGNDSKALSRYNEAADKGSNEGRLKAAKMYLDRGNIEEAVRQFKKVDIKADPQSGGLAHKSLGDIYREGRGKYNKDTKTAFDHYKVAADKGKDPEAMYQVGCMYFDGEGTEMNLEESFKMFQSSADLGNTDAMYRLGLAYIFGQGTEKDDKKGVEYVKKSAKKHNREAQYIFGLMYSECVGVEKNYKKSAKWLNEAVKQGHIDARNILGILYVEGKVFSLRNLLLDIFGFCKGKGVKYDLNKAVDLFRRSADEDDPYAQSNLGYMYMNGFGVDQDYNKALDLFRKTEVKDLSLAQCNLGLMYMNGWGVNQDYGVAIYLFRKAEAQGVDFAQFNLGLMYMNGWGVKQDYAEAKKWYEKAANQGLAEAQYVLGYMYAKGDGVKQNYAEAEKWWRQAAEQGHAEAQYCLGQMYEKGHGVPADKAEARKWYEKAAAQGHEEAKAALENMK